jgi:hypothetical protein
VVVDGGGCCCNEVIVVAVDGVVLLSDVDSVCESSIFVVSMESMRCCLQPFLPRGFLPHAHT